MHFASLQCSQRAVPQYSTLAIVYWKYFVSKRAVATTIFYTSFCVLEILYMDVEL